ncbi:hypothetical protein BDZ89DRAFT_1148323 [Hymenopellis radicata]|nr:hypothetical protein BDZ89DRAFT_1148323 [Hymenopellis radicata]
MVLSSPFLARRDAGGDNYFDCFVSDEGDPDMQGFLVRLSAFIVNICLIKWSKGDLIGLVGVVFLQVYTILLATFISMRNKDLSIPTRTLLSSHISPLSVYFVYATVRFLFCRRTLLYSQEIPNSRRSQHAHHVIPLDCHAGLDVLCGDHVFGGDDGKSQCIHPSFRSWWFYRLVEFYIYVNWTYYLIPAFLALKFGRPNIAVRLWEMAVFPVDTDPLDLLHVYTKIYLDCGHGVASKFTGLWLQSAIGLPFTSMAWFYWLVAAALEMRMALGLEPLDRPEDVLFSDVFAFGQLLAGAGAIEPIFQVFKLAWKRRQDIWAHTKGLPRWMWWRYFLLYWEGESLGAGGAA